MAVSIDIAFLASTYAVPEVTFTTLINAPSQDLVLAFFQQLVVAASDFESAKSEKLRTELQLEAAVRGSDARVKQVKDSFDRNLKELEALKRQLNDSETARASLESTLHNLQSSTTNSSSELQTLQSRISTLEASNRDLTALLDSKSASHDALADELKTQQQKIISLRREVSELEEKLQKSERQYNDTKFHEQNLQHEIELAKKNNEYLEDDRERKSKEYTKYRKEKAAQITKLQRDFEEVAQQAESLRRSESALKSRVNDGIRKLEEAYAKIESLKADANQAQESFRLELQNAHKLSDLHKESALTARTRLQDVQDSYERLQDTAAEEVSQLQAEVDAERLQREALEQEVAALESQIETLQAELAEERQNAQTTPRRSVNGNGAPATPLRGGSPFTPASSRLKASLSMTQLYSENTKMRGELEAERNKNEKLRQTLDGMIHDLERQQPGIEELRLDHARIQSDLDEMSNLLDEATKDRDATRKEARKLEGQVSGLSKESDLLRQQLRDLSMQIKILLTEAQAHEVGLENLTPMDQALLEKAARGEIDMTEIDGMSDTGRVISERLTVFRNIEQLQEQNQKLLHLTRKLGEEMEGEEAMEKKRQHEQDQEELEQLREQNAKFETDVKSLQVRSESYIRERDMFRRMLKHRGQLPVGESLEAQFGQSTNSLAASTGPQVNDPTQASKDLADYNRLLKELQSQYDAYRQESATDQAALKDQLNRAGKEKSDLQSEVSKTSSQLTLAGERYELLRSNFDMLRNENTELQKRSSALAETANKQEARTQQVAEDLIEAKSFADGLRNENSNLKSERELWKRIETRLGEDNGHLLDERTRLNKMLSDQQSLQNERELADSDARRRLQNRVDALETELQTAKRNADDATAEAKKASQRYDYEQEKTQTRIDDLLKSLGNTREKLVAAETTRDQLQSRVDELKIELRNAEERTLALQPRLTSRPTAGTETLDDQENQLSIEQQLGVENADLKRDLELGKNQLQQAQQDVKQYQEISQAAEEELQSLTTTHDAYREETDKIIEEKEVKIQDLEKLVEEISSELATTNSELSELRTKQNEVSSRFHDQKAIFDSEIARLRNEGERLAESSKLHQDDLRAQAEIAQRAQQNYEEELVKHAEAAKDLQAVRAEFNVIKTQVATFKADSEASKTTLQENEEIWAETRSKYEQELSDLKTRREDVIAQNNRLHKQLETVGEQITALKKARPASNDTGSPAPVSVGDSNRQEIINWLRKEKEILEVQLELSKQEAKRLKQRVERTEGQLDDTTEKLNFERQAQTEREQTAITQGNLMESIQQLNLFRESNASLRNESNQAKEKLKVTAKRVEELNAQLEPLKTRLLQLENDGENKDGEIKLLQEDRDRWQKRAQDILSKYDRVDPVELEALKQQVEALEIERAALKQTVDGIDARLQATRDEMTTEFEGRRSRLVESAKEKARQQNKAIQEKQALLDAAQKEVADAKVELAAIKGQLAVGAASMTDIAMGDAPPASETTQNSARIAELESSLAEEQGKSAALDLEAEGLRDRVAQLESHVAQLEQELATSRAEVERLQTLAANASQLGDNAAEVELLRVELASAKEELELARANALANGSAGGVSTEQIDQLVAQRVAPLENDYQEKLKTNEDLVKQRSEHMREKLNGKLKDLRAKDKEALELQIHTLKTEHASEIERIKSDAPATGTEAVQEAPATPATPAVASPSALPVSDPEVKRFISTNTIAQEVLRRNITKQVEVTKAIYEKKLSEQAEQQEQAQRTAVDNATALEQKRQGVKFNMAEKRAKDAQAKIDVVSAAANETPQKPVVEVWAVAKVARAQPPAVVPAPTQAPAQAPPIPPTGSSIPTAPSVGVNLNSFGQPTPNALSSSVGSNINPFAQSQGSTPASTQGQVNPFAPQPAASKIQAPTTAIPQPGSGLARPGSVGGSGARVLGQLVNNAQNTSQIPQGQRGGRGGNAGRGGSGIPRGGTGGSMRGSGIGRGGRGGLNAAAGAFTPGGQAQQQAGAAAKRPNDGSLNTDNKRTRGS